MVFELYFHIQPGIYTRPGGKKARTFSKKLPQPILSAWLFDSDAVGLSIFHGRKCVASHIFSLDGPSKMGNIPLFCRTWNLPEEDVSRLRMVWKKGSAEDQLYLTAALMGLPLYHDSIELPEKQYIRDTDTVDQWIKARPAPPKVKNKTKAELIQEIPEFRHYGTNSFTSSFYISIDPFDHQYAYDRFHLWKTQADGTIREIWSTKQYLQIFSSKGRMVCVDFHDRTVQYDSAGQLPNTYLVPSYLQFLDDGRMLLSSVSQDNHTLLSCCKADGSVKWTKDLASGSRVLSWSSRELILENHTKEDLTLTRIDIMSGDEIETLHSPVGLNPYQKVWHNNAWWITHDGHILENGVWNVKGNCLLIKLDGTLKKETEVHLPSYTQEIFFSPVDMLIYVFLFEEQVLVIDCDHMDVINTLKSKSYLAPLYFDDWPLSYENKYLDPRLWMQRDGSTVEAWDNLLTKPMSRHRLKGEIVGYHLDQNEKPCVATWDEKRSIFRIYRLT